MDRWIGLGGMGWVNIVESLIDQGMPVSDANREHLETIHRRLGVIINQITPPSSESGNVYMAGEGGDVKGDHGEPLDPPPTPVRKRTWIRRNSRST